MTQAMNVMWLVIAMPVVLVLVGHGLTCLFDWLGW